MANKYRKWICSDIEIEFVDKIKIDYKVGVECE